jgi:hypothetical protein
MNFPQGLSGWAMKVAIHLHLASSADINNAWSDASTLLLRCVVLEWINVNMVGS